MQKKFSVGINEDELVSVNGGWGIFNDADVNGGADGKECTALNAIVACIVAGLIVSACTAGVILGSVTVHKANNLKKRAAKAELENVELQKLVDEASAAAQQVLAV